MYNIMLSTGKIKKKNNEIKLRNTDINEDWTD